jgi:riboflavin kinase/FMN adenylyltransferase
LPRPLHGWHEFAYEIVIVVAGVLLALGGAQVLDTIHSRSEVASFGVRPMFEGRDEVLETYIFDWDGDLYGRANEIDLIAYIRPEAKFDTIDELIAQIGKDAEEAKRLLA